MGTYWDDRARGAQIASQAIHGRVAELEAELAEVRSEAHRRLKIMQHERDTYREQRDLVCDERERYRQQRNAACDELDALRAQLAALPEAWHPSIPCEEDRR